MAEAVYYTVTGDNNEVKQQLLIMKLPEELRKESFNYIIRPTGMILWVVSTVLT